MSSPYVVDRDLADVFRETADKYSDHCAIATTERRLTFREFDHRSDRVAAGLQAAGVKKGDRIGLYCVNGDHFAIAYMGIVKAGATVVPINLLLTPVEIAYILDDAEASGLIYHVAFAKSVNAVREQVKVSRLKLAVAIGSQAPLENDIPWSTLVDNPHPLTKHRIDPTNDLVSIIYTSGTTGKPKGAMLTHRNLASNAKASQIAIKIEAGKDRVLVVLPMFHAFAATVGMLTPLLGGCTFIPVAKFDPELVANAVEHHQATIFLGVPSMYNVLLHSSDDVVKKFRSITHAISGGAAMPQELMKRFEQRFGILIYEGDGPTECSPVTCVNPINGLKKYASVGLPVPGVEMCIKDENGDNVADNSIGEICVRAPSVMKGYWKKEEATRESFFGEWFRTGDLGYRDDDGYFFMVDRIKDMIIVNGMNVYPRVVEEVLYQHDAVKEAAVIGEADELHGENVVAFIVLKPGIAATAADFRSFCRDKLGRHQIPKKFVFISELPKNAAGKILKRELRKHGEVERGVVP